MGKKPQKTWKDLVARKKGKVRGMKKKEIEKVSKNIVRSLSCHTDVKWFTVDKPKTL